MTRGRDKNWPGLFKDLALWWWIGMRFFDAWEICELRQHIFTCLASLYAGTKTTPNKQRAAKQYKMAMNWAQVTQKKQQQAQVYVSTIYFYIYAYISKF